MTSIRLQRYSASGKREVERIISRIRQNDQKADDNLAKTVSEIINTVRRDGDHALIHFAKMFDSAIFSKSSDLKVNQAEFKKAYRNVSRDLVRSLSVASMQIESVSRKQKKRFEERKYKSPLGFEIRERYTSLARVGGYIPGGLASYPSTVLMICIPARIAGVKEIVLSTPPRKDGSIEESVLVAADICGVKEIIKSGGAQGVAALAYGTKSIEKVDFIAGPGNKYVTEAKRQVEAAGQVQIDSLAGPTELLVLADRSANPVWVAEDMISQAEHGNRTLVGLVSDSASLIRDVQTRIANLSERPRLSHIKNSRIFAVLVPTKPKMVEFAELFSPEHLEVMMESSETYARMLTSSGLVLVGDYTPCSSTDYIVGTNHILPTGGSAKYSSGLGVENFLKRVTNVKGSRRSLSRANNLISILATNENLMNHAYAASSRFN